MRRGFRLDHLRRADAWISVSNNAGVSWTTYNTDNGLQSNTVNAIAVSGSTLYAGTDSGLPVSTTRGAAWKNTLVGRNVHSLAVIGTVVYAGALQGPVDFALAGIGKLVRRSAYKSPAHWCNWRVSCLYGGQSMK
jgi:hypothetical protein